MLFRPSSVALAKAKSSSTAWLARQFRDPYVKQRLSDPRSYRARSAFKLLEIDNQWDEFLSKPDVKAVVDLGAAPGGWSQVVAGKLGWDEARPHEPTGGLVHGEKSAELTNEHGTWSVPKFPSRRRKQEDLLAFDPLNIDDVDEGAQNEGRGTIVAVDLLRMQPIHGVHCIQGDFLSPEVETLVHGLLSVKGNLEGKVDVILSDMAANASGNDVRDIESSLQICRGVFEFARRNLRSAESIGRRRGGVLLMKHFTHPLLQKFRTEMLMPNFNDVKYIKPGSSRGDSREGASAAVAELYSPQRRKPSQAGHLRTDTPQASGPFYLRVRVCVKGNDEGRRWFKDTYNIELADHHRQDGNVRLRLNPLLKEKNIDAYSCHTAPRRLEGVICDWLIVTQILLGPFVHNGPDYYEEVYDEKMKPVPGVKEEKVKAQLKKEFGIHPCGFKSYYSDWYY
ncbi:hypothetical protein D9615_007563 [Tricholomella constricta]|uniref:rRNA methyltransferase 2, mitochondrial n=1 Tax=Tricholomella constricta TaxID=117010 RepID=A0A8H5H7E1_9AGAR|nr:hypothetical protein D9615_007563 [Tricholomella constricta]